MEGDLIQSRVRVNKVGARDPAILIDRPSALLAKMNFLVVSSSHARVRGFPVSYQALLPIDFRRDVSECIAEKASIRRVMRAH